jgi:urease accessory protein
MASDWFLWQLADSGFPAGGFAHSWGLEAARQTGELRGPEELRRLLREIAWQAGYAGLPLVNAAHRRPREIAALDARCEAFLTNHVANRASRTQGRAFLSTCAKSFPGPGLARLEEEQRGLKRHYAPVFGAALAALGCDLAQAQKLYLHLALRGALSAAVRLSVVGPHEAQGLQAECAPILDAVAERCAALDAADLAQVSPLMDMIQAGHDELYSRLFQS